VRPAPSSSPSLLGSLLLIYSAAMSVLLRCLRPVARFFPAVQRQLEGRPNAAAIAKDVIPARRLFSSAVLFYCSSAGEYEQARPLIDRLEEGGKTYVHVLFFSRSGLDFLRARGDKTPAHLAPATDSVWEWGTVFAALRPDVVAVVRHELWPGFLSTARHYAKVYLVCASRSAGESRSLWKRQVRGALLRQFDAIFAVATNDADFFHKNYAVSRAKLRVVGDTKYDRALDRARRRPQLLPGESGVVERLSAAAPAGATKRLVVGSAHPPDLEVVLAARRILGDAAKDWQLLIAPHEVDKGMVARMEERCVSEGYRVLRYSALAVAPLSELKAGSGEIVLVDSLGKLAELYGAGTAAFVGGAVHRQVHNVLEPASHGLPLAFGTKYANSGEAVRLVDAGLATPVVGAEALAAWWAGLSGDLGPRRAAVTQAVQELGGAAERILAEWPKAEAAAPIPVLYLSNL
jgi:3-deoxy-D-manno-octulosonic-acid transferase